MRKYNYSPFILLVLVILTGCSTSVYPPLAIKTQPLYPPHEITTSISESVNSALERLRHSMDSEELANLNPDSVLAALNPQELDVLSTQHIRFSIDNPAEVLVIRRVVANDQPFWLNSLGFKQTEISFRIEGTRFDVWKKRFEPGIVGLGVNSLTGGGRHYMVALKPVDSSDINVSVLEPDFLEVDALQPGVQVWEGRNAEFEELPTDLLGLTYIRTPHQLRDQGRMLGLFQLTNHPSGPEPDQIVLTWGDDPKTTQSIQWRTDESVKRGFVSFGKKSDSTRFNPSNSSLQEAETIVLETPNIGNDPRIHRHTVVLRDLEPGTSYSYSIGDGTTWSEPMEFTTAPDTGGSFSFIYLGDAQNGLDQWGTLLDKAFQNHPEAAFYVMAGDIVNRGFFRDDWDSFFYNTSGVYDRRNMVPAIGNHDNQGGHPWLYLNLLDLLKNSPPEIEQERIYTLRYGDFLLIVLDSNLDPELQEPWLTSVLEETDAKWKFVTFHHPVYSSAPNRDNLEIRKEWVPIFDQYHVDMVLQGHDHAYLRTPPMVGNQKVEDPADGTIYVVAFSGTKKYRQVDREYIDVGFTDTPTYQVIDIDSENNQLRYRCYDEDGNVRDELLIQK